MVHEYDILWRLVLALALSSLIGLEREARRLPVLGAAPSELRLLYVGGQGTLRRALEECANRGFSISDLTIRKETDARPRGFARGRVEVELELWGKRPVAELAANLQEIDGVIDVGISDGWEFGV